MFKKAGTIKILLTLLLAFVFLTGASCTKGGDSSARDAYRPVTITYWRVWDNEDDLLELMNAYRALHPNVSFEYRKLRYEEYEDELLNALAEDRGPDIFSVHNTWMERHKAKILPMPSQVRTPVKFMSGTVKKEEVYEFRARRGYSPSEMRKSFLDVVYDDAVMPYNSGTADKPVYQDVVWGVPLALDNLVLYYNRDILNTAGVIEPAKNWTEFQEHVKRMTRIDGNSGDILVAGAAIGTGENVARSFDILSLLMMQNQATMINDNDDVVFNRMPAALADQLEVPPGRGALEYYLQFASPLSEAYTWNENMPDSLEAFMAGRVGYFFGYAYHKEFIDAQAPQLDYEIAPMPQVSANQKVNYANYWLETVSNKTEVVDYAWDFLLFATSPENIEKYLDKVKKPTALRSTEIINKQLQDPVLTVFADQLLTSRSWYHGANSAEAEQAFNEMIKVTLQGELTPERAMLNAVDKIESTR